MQYWEEMQSKWGFNDGNSIPAGAEVYRTVYIQAVNRLAEQLNSTMRAVAYNRMGMHNYCLILFHNVKDLKDVPLEQYIDHVDIPAEVVEPDEAMDDAIGYAHDAQLDSWLHVSVEIDPDLDDYLEQLKPVDENTPLILKVAGELQHFYAGGEIEIIKEDWLKNHFIAPEKNNLTIKQVFHYDANLWVRDTEDIHHVVSAHWARVTHIPERYREHNSDQTPIPPYRVELVEAGDDYTPAVEEDVAERYFSNDEAERVVNDLYRRAGGIWEIVNGYGNTCLLVSDDDPPSEDESHETE